MSEAGTDTGSADTGRDAFLSACRSPDEGRRYLQPHVQAFGSRVRALRQRWEFMLSAMEPWQPNVPPPSFRMISREKDFSALSAIAAPAGVSIDIFDTCLVRLLDEPVDVFTLLGYSVQKRCGMEATEFASLRQSVEDALRAAFLESGEREDVLLEAVYAELGRRLDWEAGFTKSVQAAELRLERLFLRADPEMRKQVHQWNREGIPLAYASEMYLDSGALESLLLNAGFPVVGIRIFSSGETGCSKGTGKLYDHVLDALGRENVFHVGDNPVSDGEVPRQKSLTPCLVRTPKAVYGDLFSNCLHAVATDPSVPPGDDFWEHFGYSVVGPLHVAFAVYLYKFLRDSGMRRMFFLSRDGWFTRKVFRELQAAWGEIAADEYLYVSREFLGLGSMEEITAADWDFILKPSPLLRLKDVFERLGIPPEAYVTVCGDSGLGDPERRICHHWGFLDPADRDRLYHAICRCIEPFHAYREQVGQQLRDYLNGSGLLEKNALFADVGWGGSSHRAIQRLSAPGKAPHGAYFALVGEVPDGTRAFFSGGLDGPRRDVLLGSVALLEFIFGSPEPSVRLVEKAGADWNPVFRKELPHYDVQAWNRMEKGILSFTRNLLEVVPQVVDGDGSDFTEDLLRDLIFRPGSEMLKHLGPIRHGEGWGTEHRLRLLPDFDAMPDAGVLHEAYAYCPWKPGLARMLDDLRE